MAGSKSDYSETSLLNHVLRNTSYTPATTVYLALYTVTPADGSEGTEVTGGSYVRKSIGFGAPSVGSITNSADVTFDVATGNWGTIVAWAVCSASAATGNILYYGSMGTNRAINTGEQIKFSSSQITITED